MVAGAGAGEDAALTSIQQPRVTIWSRWTHFGNARYYVLCRGPKLCSIKVWMDYVKDKKEK